MDRGDGISWDADRATSPLVPNPESWSVNHTDRRHNYVLQYPPKCTSSHLQRTLAPVDPPGHPAEKTKRMNGLFLSPMRITAPITIPPLPHALAAEKYRYGDLYKPLRVLVLAIFFRSKLQHGYQETLPPPSLCRPRYHVSSFSSPQILPSAPGWLY
jgi:hypothetical protein